MRITKNNIQKLNKGQEQKSKILAAVPKKGQEEMVGFGLIVILVAIIFIAFIFIYIKKPVEPVVDYEASSYLQALLQYTTKCQEDDMENLTVQKLIIKCWEGGSNCYYRNMNPCTLLNDTIKEITKESWDIVPNKSAIKGYSMTINISEGKAASKQIINVKEGVVTNEYRGTNQNFGKEDDYIVIFFRVYE